MAPPVRDGNVWRKYKYSILPSLDANKRFTLFSHHPAHECNRALNAFEKIVRSTGPPKASPPKRRARSSSPKRLKPTAVVNAAQLDDAHDIAAQALSALKSKKLEVEDLKEKLKIASATAEQATSALRLRELEVVDLKERLQEQKETVKTCITRIRSRDVSIRRLELLLSQTRKNAQAGTALLKQLFTLTRKDAEALRVKFVAYAIAHCKLKESSELDKMRLRQLHSRCDGEAQALRQRNTDLANQHAGCGNEKTRLKQLHSRCDEDSAALREKYTDLANAHAGCADVKTRLEELDKRYEKLDEERSRANVKYTALKERHAQLTTELEDRNLELAEQRLQSTRDLRKRCPDCTASDGNVDSDTITDLRQQIETLKAENAEMERDAVDLNQHYRKLGDEFGRVHKLALSIANQMKAAEENCEAWIRAYDSVKAAKLKAEDRLRRVLEKYLVQPEIAARLRTINENRRRTTEEGSSRPQVS